MRRLFFALVVAAGPLGLTACAGVPADEGGLTPLAGRLTDEVVFRDLARLDSLDARVAALRPRDDAELQYAAGKARAWAAMARTEYTDNDGTGIADFAFRQGRWAVSAVESGDPGRAWETTVGPGSSRVRPDLWERAEALKRHEGFSCADTLVALLEVRLVWAGNEELTCRPEDPRPHAEAAEALARTAEEAVARCAPPPPVRFTVPDAVHFAFDDVALSPLTRQILDEVVAVLEAVPEVRLRLRGHTDLQGDSLYNEDLSRRRAEAVRAYLASRGIETGRINRGFSGEREPLPMEEPTAQRITLDERPWMMHALNRRVELYYTVPEWVIIEVVPELRDVQTRREE